MVEGFEAILGNMYNGWARGIVGGSFWNNAAVASVEVGWELSGSGRVVLAVAVRRSKLWALPDDDFYKIAFLGDHQIVGSSGENVSLAILARWGILDWPVWVSGNSHRGGLFAY